jgi:hypothetical protein
VHPTVSESFRILTYGYDAVLLDTRRLLLTQAGYQAETAANAQEFKTALDGLEPSFKLLVLCHTVPLSEQTAIAASAERSKIAVYRVPALVPPTDFLAHVSALLA